MTFNTENVGTVMGKYKNHVEAQFLLNMDLCPHVSMRKWTYSPLYVCGGSMWGNPLNFLMSQAYQSTNANTQESLCITVD